VLFTVALAFVVCWLPWRRPSTRWTRLPLLTPAVCTGSRPALSASLHRCYCEYQANGASSLSCWFICLRPVASHSLHPPPSDHPLPHLLPTRCLFTGQVVSSLPHSVLHPCPPALIRASALSSSQRALWLGPCGSSPLTTDWTLCYRVYAPLPALSF
jgi:hypothetical protein